MKFQNFFFMKENPFGETPDTRFYYPSQSHRYALEETLESIDAGKSLTVITGEIGVGKTVLSRKLIHTLNQTAKTSLILQPILSEKAMLQQIFFEFGVPWEDRPEWTLNIARLNDALIENANSSKRSILVIDEAQALTKRALEFVRLLSNLESERSKLLQIVLIGQEELNVVLSDPSLRQIAQRIHKYLNLKPLTSQETREYIEMRIRLSGAENYLRFRANVFPLIYEYTNGFPRLINKVMEFILEAAARNEIRYLDYALCKQLLGTGILRLKITRALQHFRGIA